MKDIEIAISSLPYRLAFKSLCFSETTDFAKIYPYPLPQILSNAVKKRKTEFLAGRYCAHSALMDLMEEQPAPIAINPDRSPAWPDSISGSISHTDGLAIAIAGYSREIEGIGIDCERILPEKKIDPLASMIINPQEVRIKPNDMLMNEFLTLAFSAKESIYKSIKNNKHLNLDFLDAEIIHIDTSFIFIDLHKRKYKVYYCINNKEMYLITLTITKTKLQP